MKILVIRLSSLGDIILAQPVCSLLQKAYPDAELSFLCKEQYQQLPLLFDPPVKVLTYRKNLAFHRHLRSCRYDLVIDLHAKFASMLVSLWVRSPLKTRYHKQRHTRMMIVKGHRELAIDSTVSLYVSALKKIGISSAWQPPRLATIHTPNLIPAGDRPMVAIIPGANHFTKRYPVAQWLDFINANPDWEYHLFGSGDDSDICCQIANSARAKCTDHSAKLDLMELHSALGSCDLVISGDTGPMHLAATLQKPQIAIFGSTHPRLGFKPLNPHARMLCADLPCQPCHLHGDEKCPLGHFKCMTEITPEILGHIARQLLNN